MIIALGYPWQWWRWRQESNSACGKEVGIIMRRDKRGRVEVVFTVLGVMLISRYEDQFLEPLS